MVGAGLTPTTVANSILRRAFGTDEHVTPMKLQKLLFFVTCLYQRYTGRRLLTESFQPWQYGPFAAASTTSSKDSAASRLIGMLRMLWGRSLLWTNPAVLPCAKP